MAGESVIKEFLDKKTKSVKHDFTEHGRLWYRKNCIAYFDDDTDDLYINSCGWMTNTTKDRLNKIPNVHIQQKQGIWYLNGNQWNGKLIKVER